MTKQEVLNKQISGFGFVYQREIALFSGKYEMQPETTKDILIYYSKKHGELSDSFEHMDEGISSTIKEISDKWMVKPSVVASLLIDFETVTRDNNKCADYGDNAPE
ncbi:MAG: hypothetical protein PHN84_04710 [Desulfuromonadaceae bacterium]|nr:hypothetical protein [Desulfuromonadaceae bacterium]MDD2856034.1 hypothetical protein [Desulfuromonadaceae bacterium]